jgi:HK97 family phage prohead protease
MDEGKREALVSIPWEVLDTYNTDFERSCFDEYLGQRSPVVCWQHDKKEPIGRATEWQKGERANEFVLRFSDFDAVPRARQAYVQMQDGDITDVSFYYDQAKAVAHPNTRGAIRFIKARMPEISPVTVGSIPGAMVTGIRAAADMAGVAELVRSKVITEEEGRTMLGLAGDVPVVGERESIVVGERAKEDEVAAVDEAELGERAEVETLALAVASALSATSAVLTRSADEIPQPVIDLVDAAAQANGDLLEALGVAEESIRAAQDVVEGSRDFNPNELRDPDGKWTSGAVGKLKRAAKTFEGLQIDDAPSPAVNDWEELTQRLVTAAYDRIKNHP